MAKKLFVVVMVLAFSGLSLSAQSKPSIQGVWRPVEATITNPNPAPRGLGKGTHTNLQPALLIFTGKHYSQILDTAGKPRPTGGFKVADKPSAEEMESQWGPFVASGGTYELSGTTLTTKAIVSKNPALQGKGFTRYTIKLDGNNLVTTQVENQAGKIANPNTIKYVRVE
jgi:hypothetical protein